jgi:hypothetical protein
VGVLCLFVPRLENEFAALDTCVKTHELQLKEYQKIKKMLEEIEREQGERCVQTKGEQ